MAAISISEAKAQFSEMVARAEGGETLVLVRRGRPVATISPIKRRPEQIDFAALHSEVSRMPMSPDSRDLIRQMRDDARY